MGRNILHRVEREGFSVQMTEQRATKGEPAMGKNIPERGNRNTKAGTCR